MKYSLEEAYNIVKRHDEETNVQKHYNFDNEEPADILNEINVWLKEHPDMYNSSFGSPIITIERFFNFMNLYNFYLKNKKEWNEKGLWAMWYPLINELAFYRSEEQMKNFMSAAIDDNKTFGSLSAANLKTIDVYEKGVELVYSDDAVDFVEFDEIDMGDEKR